MDSFSFLLFDIEVREKFGNYLIAFYSLSEMVSSNLCSANIGPVPFVSMLGQPQAWHFKGGVELKPTPYEIKC